jgi:magnesium-transporting ATPase (P-type)
LQVTLEVAILAQSLFMFWDEAMTTSDGVSMRPYSSDLNSDLGLIDYVMCDKTGTLTANKMLFRACSVAGRVYSEPLSGEVGREREGSEKVELFLRVLAVCNEVVPEMADGQGKTRGQCGDNVAYASQSPDEVALVTGASENGTILTERNEDGVRVLEGGVERGYAVVGTLNFSSERRRMSVLVRDDEGKYTLLSKGADQVMIPRLAPGEWEGDGGDRDNLAEFASKGHRVMVCSARRVDQEEATAYLAQRDAADRSINARDEMIEAAFDKLERGMLCVGVTCVEDKLREQVPETIRYLLDAG